MANYLGQLDTALAKLTSAPAKTDLGALIDALKNASSPSAASQIATTVGKLGSDCP
jgi:hypothetical protein